MIVAMQDSATEDQIQQGIDRLVIRGFLGHLARRRLSKRSMARDERPARTKSGCSEAMRSTAASSSPPTLGNAITDAGQFE